MKDNKRIVEIDGVKYSIDKTLDTSPAIYKHIKGDEFCHIDDANFKLNINSLVSANDDVVIIIARKVK